MDFESNFSRKTAANDDLNTALRLPLKRGLATQENLSVSPQQIAALWNACQSREIDEARALIQNGVDPSLVLLRHFDDDARETDPSHGSAIQSLISLGADLTTVLSYMMLDHRSQTDGITDDWLQVSRIETLLLLGANGQTALANALESRDANAVKMLLNAGVKAENLLGELAIQGDTTAIALLHHPRVDTKKVILDLVKRHHPQAVSLILQSYPYSGRFALLRLLENNDTAGIKLMLAAGKEPAGWAMQYLSRPPIPATTNAVVLLSRLITAGADPSRILVDIARKDNDLSQLETLFLAGASPSDALKCAMPHEMKSLYKTLFLTAGKVNLIKTQVKIGSRVVEPDAGIVQKILCSDAHLQQPGARSIALAMNGVAERLNAAGKHDIAAMILALEASDWIALKKLSNADPGLPSKTLPYIAQFDSIASLRLLKALGATIDDTVAYAIAKGDIQPLHQIIHAGWPSHRVLAALLSADDMDLAHQLIDQYWIDTHEMLRNLASEFGNTVLQQCIPALSRGIKELYLAFREGDIDFAEALLAVGVDVHETLTEAVSNRNRGVVTQLLSQGANTSFAVVHALEQQSDHVAGWLFALGADPYLALEFASERNKKVAMHRLGAMGVSLNKSSMH